MSIVRYLAGMAAVMLILLPLWALARLLFLHLRGRRAAADWRHEVLLAVLVLYLAALASQTILPRIGWADGMLTIQRWNGGPPNYKPFYMIRLMLFRVMWLFSCRSGFCRRCSGRAGERDAPFCWVWGSAYLLSWCSRWWGAPGMWMTSF